MLFFFLSIFAQFKSSTKILNKLHLHRTHDYTLNTQSQKQHEYFKYPFLSAHKSKILWYLNSEYIWILIHALLILIKSSLIVIY